MNSKQAVIDLVAQCKPWYSLPHKCQDLEQLWHRDWCFAGHTFEVVKPGQYLTLQIGDYPVAVVRSKDGQVRAFRNACRHCGAKVCEHEQGKVAKLVCPYHKWTYKLDGSLLLAGNMGADFDKSQYHLKPVQVEVVEGFI